MRKFKLFKIAMLFLLTLCSLSYLIICLKSSYLKDKQLQITNNIQEQIDNQKEKKQEWEYLSERQIGLIIIPSINVKAPIYEGVSKEVLKYTVGHFENTSIWFRKCSTCFT